MVPQKDLIDCLKMYKIFDKVIKFIDETMKNWRMELTARGKSLAEVKIQRGIFQEDALSPLLMVTAITYSGNVQADTSFINRKKRLTT